MVGPGPLRRPKERPRGDHQRDDDGVVTLTLDDGKVNAFDLELFAELNDALDGAADAAAVVIAGREGIYSGGLNTKKMAALDDDGLTELLVEFGRTIMRVWLEPRPLVAAATGHAIAGGTILAMACDHAVAADGRFGWGLTETTIGLSLPRWTIALARGNVRADRLDDLLLPGTTVPPAEAVAVGFADVVAAPGDVLEVARARARELAALPRPAYAETKRRLRGPAAEAVLPGIEADTRELLAAR
jgi:enoyl-CoA hydratase